MTDLFVLEQILQLRYPIEFGNEMVSQMVTCDVSGG